MAPRADAAQLDHTAPSQLEGGTRVAATRVLDLDSSVATSRGILIHALFEQITWLDEEIPRRELWQQVAARIGCGGLNMADQLDAFQRMLAMPEIAANLRRDFYQPPREPSLRQAIGVDLADKSLRLELHNERRFAVRDGRRLLSGIIDRLVLLYDGQQLLAADILDYKTDSASREDDARLDRLVAYYQPQIEAYRRAVSGMFHLPATRISARLLFVGPGVVRTV